MSSPLPKNWLAIRLSALGDLILTSGPLHYLHETHGWNFHVLTRKGIAPVLENHPGIDRLIFPNEHSLKGKEWFRAARELSERYKGWGLLDLHGTLRSQILTTFWKGPVRRYPKFSLTRRVFSRTRLNLLGERLNRYNVPQRYALAIEKEAPSREELRPRIWLTAQEKSFSDSFFTEHGLTERPVVALHPFATHPGKQWPIGHWLTLIRKLDAKGWSCLILGRSSEPLPAQELPENVVDATNASSLRETCALIARSRALVTGDSGPMHMGTALGVPTIGLFGPTTSHWGFFPSGEHDVVLESALHCRPCSLHGGKGCPDSIRCMRDIMPEQVLTEILRNS
ncbi:glycosyltransferase family 9 protein [Desulfobaculum bizertense]|uniref:glycosyltransferase family 9 protein n=1 Tax=Desulfobaculum bizertense TaxID=376490 RepID=UPI001F2C0F1B|nr:glycosyltransferase family 9 protein [Desulfobaculum bizertense]UIJ38092.1 glycosyltransferase family 9 protein [Desulfobaculum bizertense]